MLVSALDEIAWTLNMRGNDVHCNPVFVSYLLITEQRTVLYILPEKLTLEIQEYLNKLQVEIQDYRNVEKDYGNMPERLFCFPQAPTTASTRLPPQQRQSSQPSHRYFT